MKTRKLFLILTIALFVVSSLMLTACENEQIEKYLVSFESNGGTQYGSVESYSQVVNLPIPEKEGYTFIGWYATSDFSGEKLSDAFTPSADVTLYAKWQLNSAYYVTFESNGGTEYELLSVIGGGTANFPTPSKEYYTFDGWYLTEDFSDTKLPSSYVVTSNITLYAKWVKSGLFVSFNMNPVEDEVAEPSSVETMCYIDTALALPTPTYYGYKFLGWYDNEELNGEAVATSYVPSQDVTLYAKWQKVVYLWLYSGAGGLENQDRYEYSIGDVVSTSSLPTPSDIKVEGFDCPFKYWAYDDAMEESLAGTQLSGESITMNDHVYLVAEYDLSNVCYLKTNSDGSYTTTGNVEKVFYDNGNGSGVITARLSFVKGSSGSSNLAIRMSLVGVAHEYQQVGAYYISIGFLPGSGNIQLGCIKDGTFSHLFSALSLSSLPQSWQKKYNSAQTNEVVSALLTVESYDGGYKFYIDNELAYTSTDSSKFEVFTGTGFGIRSSTTGLNYSEFNFRTEPITISFESNCGNDVPAQSYYAGNPSLPTPTRNDGYIFTNWYYDSELTQMVTLANFNPSGDVKLYADWSNDYKTINFEPNGGSACSSIYYFNNGDISLPISTRVNYVLEGWYYDEALTNKVDEKSFDVSEKQSTLYAKWRLCSSYVTDNKDGTYTTTAGSVAKVHGEVDSLALKSYSSTFKVLNGQSSGAFGLIFRAGLVGDNAFSADTNLYYMVEIIPSSGGLQVARNPFKHIVGKNANGGTGKALTDMPLAYQAKFNEYKNNGADLEVTLTINDFADHFDFYIDGDFAYSYTYTEAELATHTNKGYGVRIGTAFVKCTYTEIEVKDIVRVTFELDNGSDDVICYAVQGNTVTFPSAPTKLPSGNTIYSFDGWYIGDNKISDSYTFDEDTILKAKYIELTGYAVTFMLDGEALEIKSVVKGATVTAPTLTTSTRTVDNTIYNYTITGWNSGDSAFDFSTPITSATTLTAVYTKTATRNGVAITFDANGNEVYTVTTGTSHYSIAGDTYESGEITYKVTIDGNGGTTKASQELALVIGLDNSKVAGKPSNVDAIVLKMNIHYGSIYLGYLSEGNFVYAWSYITTKVNNYYPELVSQLKNCRDNKTTLTLSFKVKYGPGYFAMYVDDVLFFAYNTEDANTAKIELTDANMTGSETVKTKFLSIVSGTTYHGIGFVTVQNATTNGGYVLSDIVIKEAVE